MDINFSTRHGDLAADTQDRISQKVGKLSRFHNKISSADITIDLKEGKQPSVEVCVHVDGASSFVARTQGTNLLGAIEGAVNKLEEQLKRHKEKLVGHHRDSARRHSMASTEDDEPSDE